MSAYPDLEQLWSDLADAYVAELKALAEAGCTYVQLDEVVTSCLCDPKQRDRLSQRGDDPEKLLDHQIRTMNSIIARRPKGMTIAMHTCRGNYQGHWAAEGGYDPIAERVFNEIKVDAFFLEYDTPRAGTFEPLRFFPKDKVLVLGLVSTKTRELENDSDLMKRIDEASRHVPIENLCLSPQCGFSSNYLGNPVTIDDERRKLELVVKTARAVWGSA
jgi:5-methyltetrahydropteroyltriglutamate--homocysteine methyltransferase